MSNFLYYFSQLLLFSTIAFLSFEFVRKAVNREYLRKIAENIRVVNEEYHNELIKRREKQKKLKMKEYRGFLHRINVLIDRSGIKTNNFFWFINAPLVLLVCFCSSILIYIIFNYFFKVITVSIIMGIPGFFLPIFFLESLAQRKEIIVEKVLGNFLLQLKNNTRIHNDIIEAFRATQSSCIEPLKTFTKQFLTEVNSGISVDCALENFKEKVNINRFKLFLTNVQYCYTYGGNFTELLDKTHKIIAEIEKEKKYRIQETRSARWVLFILIILDMFLYLNFINAQPAYMNIMRTTFWGQLILNANFLSIWFLLWLSYSVKKLDY